MKIIVDRDLCEAHGKCQEICPEVFKLDEEDELHILVDEVPPEHQEKVREALKRCPRLALSTDSD